MRYRDLAKEMTYEEVQVAFRILEPEGILLGWHRDEGFVRIQYRRPYSETVCRMDLLPDTVYTGTGHESQDEPWPEGDAIYRYHQFMVAKGYRIPMDKNRKNVYHGKQNSRNISRGLCSCRGQKSKCNGQKILSENSIRSWTISLQ